MQVIISLQIYIKVDIFHVFWCRHIEFVFVLYRTAYNFICNFVLSITAFNFRKRVEPRELLNTELFILNMYK